MRMTSHLLLFSVLTVVSGSRRINYCDPNLCPATQFGQHTGCHNNGRFSENCPDNIKVVELSNVQKQAFVNYHNSFRQQTAMGLTPNNSTGTSKYFPPAARMMKLVWDEEQAVLALLQLKTCSGHDSCHNTFYNTTSRVLTVSGQNIAYFYTYGDLDTTDNYISYAVSNWFQESFITPLSAVLSLFRPPFIKIGHFTQIIQDQNTRVGCAMVSWSEVDTEYQYLYEGDYGDYPDFIHIRQSVQITCNYFKGNRLYNPVYVAGTACSKCSNCDHGEFSALCVE